SLTRAWRRNNQTALTFAQRCHQINDASRQVIGGRLHAKLLVRIKGSQVVKKDFLAGLIGGFKVNCLELNQSKKALTFLGRANLSADCIARAKIKLPNLRR